MGKIHGKQINLGSWTFNVNNYSEKKPKDMETLIYDYEGKIYSSNELCDCKENVFKHGKPAQTDQKLEDEFVICSETEICCYKA